MKLQGYLGNITLRQDWLFQDGKTGYRILIPENATEAEKFAAQELTDIFQRAGVVIETVTDAGKTADPKDNYIALGNTVYFRELGIPMTQKEFKFDGYIIETVGNTHVVKGVGDTGTCFGTYGFCEYAMEYRYYAEDEIRVAAQAQNREFHIKDIPTFFGRNAYIHDTHFHPDYGFRLRINGEFCMRQAKHGDGSPWSSLTDVSNATQLLNHKTYRKEHPEWFYLNPDNEGKQNARGMPQICFSRGMLPEKEGGFHELFMKNLIENYIIPEKSKTFFMLGMSDSYDFCQCELCNKAVEKYTRSGLSMRFANMVAREVEQWRRENAPEREIYIVAFAYHTTTDAPVRKVGDRYVPVDPSVVAEDNVMIQYAPLHANYLYPMTDPVHNPEFRDSLLGWAAVAKHLAIWDYRQDFHDTTAPFPSCITAEANTRLYRQLGVMDVFNQAASATTGTPFGEMDNFARARLHWDADDSYEELCEEFRKAYYQEAEPAVTAYYKALPAFWHSLEEKGYKGHIYSAISRRKEYHSLEQLKQFQEILDGALAAVNTVTNPQRRETLRRRVEVLTLFYKMALLYCFPFSAPKEQMLDLTLDVLRITEENRITCYRHRKLTIDLLSECRKVICGDLPEEQRKTLPVDPTAQV